MNITREQIERMEAGREMDVLIAEKVMGWRRMTYKEANPKNSHYATDLRLTGRWHDSDGNATQQAEDCDDYYQPEFAWSPSTDIAAAWQVVEKIKSIDPLYAFAVMFEGKSWEAGIYDSGYNTSFDYDRSATATTAPLAICRAALLLTLGEK